jgi:hypothetical protein
MQVGTAFPANGDDPVGLPALLTYADQSVIDHVHYAGTAIAVGAELE